MGKSCRDLAQSLVECVKKSKCMQQQQQSAAAAGAGGAPPPPPPDLRDCMQQEMNEDCKELRVAYYLCRRGNLDMRTRIVGPNA